MTRTEKARMIRRYVEDASSCLAEGRWADFSRVGDDAPTELRHEISEAIARAVTIQPAPAPRGNARSGR